MFIRKKSVKGKDYAYLITNRYNKKRKQSRQRSSKYLGKIIDMGNTPSQIKASSVEEAITNTLLSQGFENTNESFSKNNVIINLSDKSITQEGRNICLKLNEGHLCNHTLTYLLDFQAPESTQSEIAHKFAEAFISAGINIDKSSFISIFSSKFKNLE